MPPAKVTCPKCDTMLKSAKPMPPGKKVRCPKCGEGFTVPGDEANEPAKTKAAPAQAKTKAVPTKTTKAVPPKKNDEDDDFGTYAVIKEPEDHKRAAVGRGGHDEDDEEDEDDPQKADLSFALDVSVKDPRGPAQAAVVQPSNWLIRCGGISFIGWMALLIIILIPVLFPLREDAPEGTKTAGFPAKRIGVGLGAVTQSSQPVEPKPPAKTKDEVPDQPYTRIAGGVDLAAIALFGWFLFILALMPIFLGMIYSGLIVFGGVKMQTMESRGWGIAAAIMAMIPIHSLGTLIVTTLVAQLVLAMFLEGVGWWLLGKVLVEMLYGPAAGIWTLRVLLEPKVKAGFEYVPD